MKKSPPPQPQSSTWIACRPWPRWSSGGWPSHIWSWLSARQVLWGARFIPPLQKAAILEVPQGYYLRTSSIDMKHGHRHGERAWHATWAWAWTCNMDDMDIQHGHGNAAWTWAYSMNMGTGMQHGHGHATWRSACSMDMDMQHGQAHAPGAWTCCWGSIVASYCCLLLFTELFHFLWQSFLCTDHKW